MFPRERLLLEVIHDLLGLEGTRRLREGDAALPGFRLEVSLCIELRLAQVLLRRLGDRQRPVKLPGRDDLKFGDVARMRRGSRLDPVVEVRPHQLLEPRVLRQILVGILPRLDLGRDFPDDVRSLETDDFRPQALHGADIEGEFGIELLRKNLLRPESRQVRAGIVKMGLMFFDFNERRYIGPRVGVLRRECGDHRRNEHSKKKEYPQDRSAELLGLPHPSLSFTFD